MENRELLDRLRTMEVKTVVQAEEFDRLILIYMYGE